jgi:hypothetical protein
MRNDAHEERAIDGTALWYVVRDMTTYIVIINRLGSISRIQGWLYGGTD